MKNFCILVWYIGWLFTTGLNIHMFVRNNSLSPTTYLVCFVVNSVAWPVILGYSSGTLLYKEK